MAEKSLKEIIFCIGDKQQLSEITGKEYEYFKPEELPTVTRRYMAVNQTFIEVELPHSSNSYECAKEEIYKEAEKLGADAIINYTPDIVIYQGRGVYTGSVRGTPVREKITPQTETRDVL